MSSTVTSTFYRRETSILMQFRDIATGKMVSRICPSFFKVSENLGETTIALVAPLDTSLQLKKQSVFCNYTLSVYVFKIILIRLNYFDRVTIVLVGSNSFWSVSNYKN